MPLLIGLDLGSSIIIFLVNFYIHFIYKLLANYLSVLKWLFIEIVNPYT